MSRCIALLGLSSLCLLATACGADGGHDAELAFDSGATLLDAGSVATFDAGAADVGPAFTADASDSPAVLADAAADAGLAPSDAAADGATADASTEDAGPDAQTGLGEPPFARVYRIALRVHRGDSGSSAAQIASVLEEVNEIWWSQAAICFEAELTTDDSPRSDGFDLWFHRTTLGCNSNGNGVYCGDHDIHTLDAPSLSPADGTQWDTEQNAARTSAHELGHGLRLDHYNGFADSNDSLMSSGRQGFKLHDTEITTARARAEQKALADTSPTPCAAPTL